MESAVDPNSIQPQPVPTIPIPTSVPIGAKIVAVLFYFTSIFFIAAGVILGFLSSYISISVLDSAGVSSGVLAGVLALVWGILSFFAGRGLWTGKNWGRVLAVTISSLYIVFAIAAFVVTHSTNYISLVVNIIIVLYLLLDKNISATFKSSSKIATVALAVLAVAVYAGISVPSLIATSQQARQNPMDSVQGPYDFLYKNGAVPVDDTPVASATPTPTTQFPTGGTEQGRDEERLAAIGDVQSSLNIYADDHSGYPSTMQAVVPAYLNAVPVAPKPADGTCTEEQNTYWYRPSGAPKTVSGVQIYPSYLLGYCLGTSIQGQSAGYHDASPATYVNPYDDGSPAN